MASTHKSLPISHAFSAKSCLLVFLCVSTPRTSQTRPSGRYKCLAKSFSRPKKPRPPRPAAPSASSQATRPPAAPRVDPSRPRHRLSDGSHVLVGKVVPVGVLAARTRRVLRSPRRKGGPSRSPRRPRAPRPRQPRSPGSPCGPRSPRGCAAPGPPDPPRPCTGSLPPPRAHAPAHAVRPAARGHGHAGGAEEAPKVMEGSRSCSTMRRWAPRCHEACSGSGDAGSSGTRGCGVCGSRKYTTSPCPAMK